jgi:hypothetical protein
MTYMQEVDNWLNEILKHLPIDCLDEAKQAIKDRIYESYRNGQKAYPSNKRKYGKNQNNTEPRNR